MDPKVQQLLQLQKRYKLRVEKESLDENLSFIKVRFYIGKVSWEVFVDNEYRYFNTSRQLICVYLVLSALEEYQEAEDYLIWCKANGLNASELSWLDYYKYLSKVIVEIEKLLGTINSYIDPLEYQLGSGSFYALLKYEEG